MNVFHFRFRIGPRIILAFALVLTIMAAITAIALWRLSSVHGMAEYLVNDKLTKQRLVSDWLNAVNLNGMRAVSIAKSDSFEVEQYFRAQLGPTDAEIDTLRARLLATEPGAAATIASTVEQQHKAYLAVREQVFQYKEVGRTADVERLLVEQMEPSFVAYARAIQKLLDYQKEEAGRIAMEAQQLYEQSHVLLICLCLLALLIGALLAWMLTRSIVIPLKRAVDIATEVARGDLTQRIDISGTDETGQLMRALKEMNDGLVRIVSQVRTDADAIAGESAQLAAGNASLHARTDGQARALERTASSMEQLTSAVRENADSASRASQLAVSTSGAAVKGDEIVSGVVRTMASINDASKRIGDITGVIDGIAFQTNILALNAAVEAARAGRHGSGFAVVAAEVRSLAQRSAVAANEIKALINDSVERVEAGATLVSHAGAAMHEIMESARNVADIMSGISGATREQIVGIEQVSQALAEMDRITQENAALSERAAAATETMQQQSWTLAQLVRLFKTNEAPVAMLPLPVATPASIG